MAAASVPAVRAALRERFAAALAAADLDIPTFYGHPGRDIPREFVSVAATTDGLLREQKRMPLRTTSMTEQYDVRVIVWHFTGEPDGGRRMAEAAWATADVLEADLRAEPTLGGLVTWALVTRLVDDDLVLDEGRAAQLLLSVTVHVNRT